MSLHILVYICIEINVCRLDYSLNIHLLSILYLDTNRSDSLDDSHVTRSLFLHNYKLIQRLRGAFEVPLTYAFSIDMHHCMKEGDLSLFSMNIRESWLLSKTTLNTFCRSIGLPSIRATDSMNLLSGLTEGVAMHVRARVDSQSY